MNFRTEDKCDNFRKSPHAIYRCEYHFVWVPKYRYKVLVEDVKPALKNVVAGGKVAFE